MTEFAAQRPGIPLPAPSVLSTPFWQGCAEQQLRFQRCTVCHQALFDPTPVCARCGSSEMRWEPSSGRGELYSWSVVHRPAQPAFRAPYVAIVVAMDEEFHLVSNLIDCQLDDLEIGLRVAATFEFVGDAIWLPYFRPDRSRGRRHDA